MRRILPGIFLLSVINSPLLAQDGDDCMLPFNRIVNPSSSNFFQDNHILNRSKKVKAPYNTRYLVANLNTVDENGECKGVNEIHPEFSAISDFSNLISEAQNIGIDLATLRKIELDTLIEKLKAVMGPEQIKKEHQNFLNYWSSVYRFKQEPIVKKSIHNFWGTKYCIGQTISVCEQTENGDIKTIARFITASRKANDIWKNYYSPINSIWSRSWDERPYTSGDWQRDIILGGSNGNHVAMYQQKVPMPNFMFFMPDMGLPGQRGNGVHEKTVAETSALLDLMGTPISLGCLRTEDFASKFIRWYIPTEAKLFIHFYEDRYRNFPPTEAQKKVIRENEEKRRGQGYLI